MFSDLIFSRFSLQFVLMDAYTVKLRRKNENKTISNKVTCLLNWEAAKRGKKTLFLLFPQKCLPAMQTSFFVVCVNIIIGFHGDARNHLGPVLERVIAENRHEMLCHGDEKAAYSVTFLSPPGCTHEKLRGKARVCQIQFFWGLALFKWLLY